MLKNSKVLLILFGVFFLLTGCGRKTLNTERDVIRYLKSIYPGEKFEIISNQEIELGDSIGGCDDGGIGHSWIIKSLDSNISFEVKDTYKFNSFVCEYGTDTNYVSKAFEEYKHTREDLRVNTYNTCYECMGLSFEKERFKSKEDMYNSIKKTINYLDNTYPFKHKSVQERIYVSIDNYQDVNEPFHLNEIRNDKKLREIIDKL